MASDRDADRPLAGVRVVITRAADQQSELHDELAIRGAEVISVPLMEVAPPADGGRELRSRLAELDDFDWLVVTSPNGARVVADAAAASPHRPRQGVAAVGPGTARVLDDAGFMVTLLPDRSVGEGLVDAFPLAAPAGRVLLPQAEAARPVVREGLEAKGWSVEAPVVYRSVDATVDPDEAARCRDADVIVFTSGSMVERFVRLVGRDHLPSTIGVIGPITAAAVAEADLPVAFEADPHTLAGLVEGLVQWVAASRVTE